MILIKYDDDGRVLVDINTLINVLQNTSIPEIQNKQQEILNAIKDIPVIGGSVELTPEHINRLIDVMTSLPFDEIINNQSDLKNAVRDNTSSVNNLTSLVDTLKNKSVKELQDIQKSIMSGINVSSDKIEYINNIITAIYDTLDYSIESILKAGDTSITLIDKNIKSSADIEIYTSIFGIKPVNISTDDGKITLTFSPQNEDMGVKVILKRNINWNNVKSRNNISI